MYFHWMFVGLILLFSSLSAEPHWNYRELGPDVWSDFYPTCGGTTQSPINIKTACTIYQSYAPFQFSSAYDLTQDFTLTNNGHTISGRQVNSSAFPLILTGGGLTEPFTFVNFHLHWGENYKSGSEHQLNSKKYAGEIHFVHTNAAQTHNTVLGIFMESSGPSTNATTESRRRAKKRDVSNTSNATVTEWEKYFQVADQLNMTNSSTIASFNLAKLVGPNLDNFYRYSGSLTTPPCSEIVTWSVFQTPIHFTDSQLEDFRAHVNFEDYRGPQLLYDRPVYRSFQNDVVSTIPDNNFCTSSLNQTVDRGSTGNSIILINKQLSIYIYVFIFSFFSFYVV